MINSWILLKVNLHKVGLNEKQNVVFATSKLKAMTYKKNQVRKDLKNCLNYNRYLAATFTDAEFLHQIKELKCIFNFGLDASFNGKYAV